MRIIEGKNVDLISPFPLGEVKRAYGWVHCYRTLTECDDSPKDLDGFIRWHNVYLPSVLSWGIIDKNHLTNIKHEAPLVGMGVFEPIISPWNGAVRNGVFHVATARKAFRTGLVDEAGQLAIKMLFEEIPTLLRVSGVMLEKNYPAKALAKRLGMKFEGLVQDALVQNNSPQNMVLFGLTRRDYEVWHKCYQELGKESEQELPPLSEPQELLKPQTPTVIQTPQELQTPTPSITSTEQD